MIRHLLASVHPPFADALEIRRTVAPGADGATGAVALTFDDGPHPEGTPRILEILASHGASATFFVVGEQVVQRPSLLRAIVEDGHDVQLHGYRHLAQPWRTRRQLQDDIERGIAAIEDALGVTPRMHRPPFGVYSRAGLRVVRERELTPLLWASWGKDWRRDTTSEEIARTVLTGLDPGDVILLHDADFYGAPRSHERTAGALELILPELRARGLATVLPG